MPDSLIDLGKIAEPLTKLVEAVRAAVGVVYEPTHIRVAKAEADAALSKAQGDAKLEAFERRVQARIAATEMRRQRNIEAIVSGAAEALPAQVSERPIEPDWVAEFFNNSQDISNETMQSLWSRILAGEVASPGSFSLRTLKTVRTFQQSDAELFANACKYAVLATEHERLPFIVDVPDYLRDKGLSTDDRYRLQTLGLVEDGAVFSAQQDSPFKLAYGGKKYQIRRLSELGVEEFPLLSLRVLRFTQIAWELYPLANATPVPDYIAALKNYVERGGRRGAKLGFVEV